MDELHQARSELERLEKEQAAMLEELLRIGMEIKAYRTKIDMLIRERPPPVNHLPAELLVLIFKYSITGQENPVETMQQLASVSHLSRDVILNTPSCWSSIRVVGYMQPAHLRTQLKRSCQALLHVSIHDWWDDDADWWGVNAAWRGRFEAQLKVIALTTNRWKTLSISKNLNWFTRRAIDGLSYLDLPSLTKVHIETDTIDDFLAISTRSPILEDISVAGPFLFTPHSNFQVLRLDHEILPAPISSSTMASLTLHGGTRKLET